MQRCIRGFSRSCCYCSCPGPATAAAAPALAAPHSADAAAAAPAPAAPHSADAAAGVPIPLQRISIIQKQIETRHRRLKRRSYVRRWCRAAIRKCESMLLSNCKLSAEGWWGGLKVSLSPAGNTSAAAAGSRVPDDMSGGVEWTDSSRRTSSDLHARLQQYSGATYIDGQLRQQMKN